MVEQETKVKLAIKIIRDIIFTEEWKIGEKYSVLEVSKKLNIGRTTLNEAIKILEKKGFIYTLPNVGFVIKPYNEKLLKEDLDLRLILEKLAIRYIINNNLQEFTHLFSIQRLNEASILVEEYDAAIAGRETFYREFFKLADADYLEGILEDTWDRQRWYSVKIKDMDVKAFIKLIGFDRELLEAVSESDFRRSVKCLKANKQFIETEIKRYINK